MSQGCSSLSLEKCIEELVESMDWIREVDLADLTDLADWIGMVLDSEKID